MSAAPADLHQPYVLNRDLFLVQATPHNQPSNPDPRIARLLDWDPERLLAVIRSNDQLVVVAYNDEPMGIVIARRNFQESAQYTMRDDPSLWVCQAAEQGWRVGVIDELVVAPSHRERGIARLLLMRAMDWLRRAGATHVATTLTVAHDRHVITWAHRLKFQPVFMDGTEHLWARDSDLFRIRSAPAR